MAPMSEISKSEETTPISRNKKRVSGLEKTQRVTPIEPTPQTQPGLPRPRRWRWILGGVAVFVVLFGLGALGGYQTGLFARQSEEGLQKAVEANYQYQLGVVDLEQGACKGAKDRFIYVIELVPDYPGAQERLIEASICASGGAPTAEAPVGPTPTPDLRGAEQIFADAQGLLAAGTWDSLLPALDTLRKNFPDFQPIEVDRMYYIALRNRGMERISPAGDGDLERGIYDLNQAEQIGPLDAEAQNFRQWAVWYLVGLSFWEVDWPQAVQYFQYVAQAAPQLHDFNFITAESRLAQAVVFYAESLIQEAERLATQKQWCSAEQKMSEANGFSPLAPEVQPTATYYTDKCILNGDEER
jgi:hypothetical protein